MIEPIRFLLRIVDDIRTEIQQAKEYIFIPDLKTFLK